MSLLEPGANTSSEKVWMKYDNLEMVPMLRNVFFMLMAICVSTTSFARDTQHFFSVKDAMSSPGYDEKLDGNIKFFFGNSYKGKINKSFGDFVSNKKTNAFGKSDNKACNWALLSALISLQERAIAEGGNAVVNIRSFYKRKEVSRDTEYECHAGAIMAGVALKGTVVRIGK